MSDSEFPLQKNNSRFAEYDARGPQRLSPYQRHELPPCETTDSRGYDSLLEYWHILFRHRITLLKFVGVGLVGAILISLVQTPIYRVRTSLEIQSSGFGEQKNSNDAGENYTSAESYVETQAKLLQSESLLEHVIDKLKLQSAEPTSRLSAFASHVRNMFRSSKNSNLSEREKLIREVQQNLTVRTSGNSRLLEITYESPDAQRAANFANTLVSEFIELSQEERWRSAQGTAEWLTSHLDKMKAQLEQSETELQEYARTAGLTVTSEKDNLAETLV